MKNNILIGGVCAIFLPGIASALSFAPDTIFHDVQSPEECVKLGGHYMEWYGSISCTTMPGETSTGTVTIIPDPQDEFELMEDKQVDLAKSLLLLGLAADQASAVASEAGVGFRIVEADGEFFPVTMDYRPGRINATTNDGVVTKYTIEGSQEVIEAHVVPDVSVVPVATPSPAPVLPNPHDIDAGVADMATSTTEQSSSTESEMQEGEIHKEYNKVSFLQRIFNWFARLMHG